MHNNSHPYAKVSIERRRESQIVDAWLSGDFCCVHIHDDEKKETVVIALSV